MHALIHHLLRAAFQRLGPLMPSAMGRLAFWLWFRPHPRGATLDSVHAFSRAEERRIDVGRKKVATYRWGRGKAILLVHGWSGRATQMSSFVAPLEAAGFQVIAVDAPAHGRSTGSRTDVWEMASTLTRLESEFGPFDGVVAHSMGVLACATAMASGALRVRRAVCLAPALDQRHYVDGFARILALPDVVATDLEARVVAMTGREFWTRAKIPAPTLVLHDEDDEYVPLKDIEVAVQGWSAARLATTHGLGHSGILRDPGVLDAVVGFLTDGARGSPLA